MADNSPTAPEAPHGDDHRTRASRRRGALLENVLLDAAWEEVAAVGYEQVTMAGVAARADTNKATLYRRWPNRTQLLAAAIDRRVPHLSPDPIDTGNLRDDLISLLEAIANRGQAAEVIPDPGGELSSYLRHHAVTDGLSQMPVVLDRAVQRGEIHHLPPSSTARLPINVLHSELCIGSTPITHQLITEIVDRLFLPLANARD
jgi:AcrR family transcriptional regulator